LLKTVRNIPDNGFGGNSARAVVSEGQNFARHSVFYLIGSAVAVLAGVLMLPVYTRALTPADYGLLETALRFVSVCISIAFLGLRQAYVRFFFEDASESWQKKLTASLIIANFGIAFSVMLPLLVAASFVANKLGISGLTIFTSVFLALWLAFEATFMAGLAQLQVRLKSAQFVLAQGSRLILLISINFVLLHVFKLGLKGAFVGNFVVALASGLVAAYLMLRSSGFIFSLPALKKMARFGLPYIPTVAFGFVIANADRYAVIYFGMLASLGLLSLASKIGEMALMIFVGPVDNIWTPFAFAVHEDADGPRRIGALYTRYAALCVLLALTVSTLAPLLVGLLANDAYESAGSLVPIVAFGWVFAVLATLSDVGILIAKQTRLKPFVAAAGAIVAVALQFALIPVAGIVGAAVATALTCVCMFVITRAVSNRLYRMDTCSQHFLSIALAAAGAWVGGQLVAMQFPSIWGCIPATVVSVSIYALSVHFAGIITWPDIKLLANKLGLTSLFDKGS
jgi:O-antigen/teichoic acid export membrane protein